MRILVVDSHMVAKEYACIPKPTHDGWDCSCWGDESCGKMNDEWVVPDWALSDSGEESWIESPFVLKPYSKEDLEDIVVAHARSIGLLPHAELVDGMRVWQLVLYYHSLHSVSKEHDSNDAMFLAQTLYARHGNLLDEQNRYRIVCDDTVKFFGDGHHSIKIGDEYIIRIVIKRGCVKKVSMKQNKEQQ